MIGHDVITDVLVCLHVDVRERLLVFVIKLGFVEINV